MPILPILFLLMGQQQSAPTPPQPRQAAAQTPATASREAPAPRASRGSGVAGPGPAVGGEIDETPVVTHHSITVRGKTINYTATVAQMPLKDAAGETEAHIFYMAYTMDGANTRSVR